jgi:hypothetical protein
LKIYGNKSKVREQENEHASRVRREYQYQKERKDKELVDDIQADWEASKEKEIEQLNTNYMRAVKNIGGGHLAAEEVAFQQVG